MLFAVALIVMRLAFGAGWAGDGMFVLFAVLFVFTGGQFIGMGLLGEYLGRMYSDVRARPRFFIEKVLRNQPAAPAETFTVDGLTSSHTSTSTSPSDQVSS
jgi:undecaprenyl-phosphate 4-deoxy-4-formamido-L-arabinose transferase